MHYPFMPTQTLAEMVDQHGLGFICPSESERGDCDEVGGAESGCHEGVGREGFDGWAWMGL